MISGQLAPSSANFVPSHETKYLIEDEITASKTNGLFQTEKINTTFFTNTTISKEEDEYKLSNNYDKEIKATTTVSNTKDKANPGLYNISKSSTAATSTTSSITSYKSNSSQFLCTTIPEKYNFLNSAITTTTATLTISETISSTATTFSNYTGTTASAIAQTKMVTTTSSNITDARGRSAALERAYVHDVYENCEEPTGPIRPRVAQFLANLDPGSIVCDVGCGNGRYLTSNNPLICTIGVDRCHRLTKVAREKGGEVALCDNLELPFRDESFDAVLSMAVVHHFATTERRVGAIRELARILRIGGRVVISVWALEQRHRRFESQDVLIPWQPPKNRSSHNLSDDEDDDDYLPPYNAYTENSTNSSCSAGDGDSSSLSSSSPGESCYSFVRRAIQKLTGGRKNAWFLDSWTSKDTKNDSSLDYEDAKDLPIELRRLEDFEELPDPPLSASLKSRSLGSILNPPPRQIVRSRSSVPSLGAQIPEHKQSMPPTVTGTIGYSGGSGTNSSSTSLEVYNIGGSSSTHTSPSKTTLQSTYELTTASIIQQISKISPTKQFTSTTTTTAAGISLRENDLNAATGNTSGASNISSSKRPKLVKQKQSLCDEDNQLPDSSIHMTNTDSSYLISGNVANSNCNNNNTNKMNYNARNNSVGSGSDMMSRLFLRKQSSLNEELMAENRLREKERIRKRIQKQMSLNETFLCRSVITKRLQIIREGFTTKLKTSTGSLERVTKNGLIKIMQNIKGSQFSTTIPTSMHGTGTTANSSQSSTKTIPFNKHNINCHLHPHHHHHHHHRHSITGSAITFAFTGRCNCTSATSVTTTAAAITTNNSSNNNNNNCSCNTNNLINCSGNEDQQKPRRHSRESGSDSSKDSSLQSDTSIESEDSFASVIFIPKPEQHSISCNNHLNGNGSTSCNCNKIPSVPTSPLIMPCPPTPAHSPAAVTASGAIPPSTAALGTTTVSTSTYSFIHAPLSSSTTKAMVAAVNMNTIQEKFRNEKNLNRFTFDEEHIKTQHTPKHQLLSQVKSLPMPIVNKKLNTEKIDRTEKLPRVTRQSILNLPQIPKFRKLHQSSQPGKTNFPIVRRSSATPAVPKLLSLELFNPATDDLDSDSGSEPSSPDSVDSVISTHKIDQTKNAIEQKSTPTKNLLKQQRFSMDSSISRLENCLNTTSTSSNIQNDASTNHLANEISVASTNDVNVSKINEFNFDDNSVDQIIINKDDNVNSKNLIYNATKRSYDQQLHQQQSVVDFAEELNAQLIKQLEKTKSSSNDYDSNQEAKCDNKNSTVENDSDNNNNDNNDIHNNDVDFDSGGEFSIKSNSKENISRHKNIRMFSSDFGDINTLKAELRERRLMLANLSTQQYLEQQQQQQQSSPTSSSSSSKTQSLSTNDDTTSVTTASNEFRYSPSLFDSKAAKRKFLRIFNDNYRQYSSTGNLPSDTAYLIPDSSTSGTSSSFEDDIIGDDDIDHDIIIEEDEDIDEDNDENYRTIYEEQQQRTSKNTIKYLECETPVTKTSSLSSTSSSAGTTAKIMPSKNTDNDIDPNGVCSIETNEQKTKLEVSRQNTNESWAHSNSTNSLDSPSQGGGATTHHRYYHVFREGELDALINHHVASLHIVSSYYERASWCVVAEKVQVWSI